MQGLDPVPVIVTPPQTLAIYRNHFSVRAVIDTLNPTQKTLLEFLRIQQRKHPPKRIVRWNPVGQLDIPPQPLFFIFPELLDLNPTVRTTDHSAHRNEQNAPQRMLLGPLDPRIPYNLEMTEKIVGHKKTPPF
jgi:hypothetical protein